MHTWLHNTKGSLGGVSLQRNFARCLIPMRYHGQSNVNRVVDLCETMVLSPGRAKEIKKSEDVPLHVWLDCGSG